MLEKMLDHAKAGGVARNDKKAATFNGRDEVCIWSIQDNDCKLLETRPIGSHDIPRTARQPFVNLEHLHSWLQELLL